MAVRFDASSDELSLTSSVVDYNSLYSFMGWFCIDVDTNAVATFLAVHNDTTNARDFVRTQSDGTSLQLRVEQSATTGSSANGSALTVGTWYHIAIVRESVSSLKLYLNGVLDATNTTNITSRVASTEMQVGLFRSSNPLNGRVAYLKSWSVALDAAQVASEMRAIRPIHRLDSLHGWWPTRPGSGERTKDYSGNGRNWTEVGVSDEDPPPVPWGARAGFRPHVGTSAITGDAAITQGADTLSATGTVAIQGDASVTQAADTLSAAGAVAIAGEAALTQAADSLAAAGTVAIQGDAAITQGADTLTATGGATAIMGEAAITQGADTLSAAGSVAIAGDASIAQAADTLSAAGAVAIVGDAAITQAADTLSAAGSVAIQGAAAITQGADTLSAAGGAPALLGDAAIVQSADTLSAAGTVAIAGAASITQGADALSAAGAVAITGAASITQDADTLSASASLGIVLMAWSRNRFSAPADAAAVIPATGRAFSAAADTAGHV